MDITIPELGEGIDGGDIVKVLVAEGDAVQAEQPVLEIETGKATIELPAPAAGRITAIHVKAGDTVTVGQSVMGLDEGAGGDAPDTDAPAEDEGGEKHADAPTPDGKKEADREAPEPSSGEDARPADKPEEKPAPARRDDTSAPAPAASAPEPAPEPPPPTRKPPRTPVAAAPSVRRFAREIGVEVEQVVGHGKGGRITIDDVKQHARQLATGRAVRGHCALEAEPLPDFTRWGNVRRESMSKIRTITAEHLGRAWALIPHVTQHGKADVTELEALRKRFAARAEAAGGKLTLTAILVRIVAAALKVHPKFNASVDLPGRTVIFKDYVHVGIAVDTERGLLVPVLRDADQKNIVQIAAELGRTARTAREGKLSPDDLQGGTFTITNLGGIGGSFFTPIINAPEVAILGVGRAEREWRLLPGRDTPEPRLMLPLSLSYDHRLIDGADGARFLRWIAEAAEEPMLISLEG